METRFVVVLSALCLLVPACGGVSAAEGDGETATTVTIEPAVVDCADPNRSDVLVTTSTTGFLPHETIVVHEDGSAEQSYFEKTACFVIAPAKLAELREALEEADLGHVPACERLPVEPGYVVETDGRDVSYGDVSISITEPCDGPPPRIQRLFDLLAALPPG